MHVGFLVWRVHSLPRLELLLNWNFTSAGTLPQLELCPNWNFARARTLPRLELYPGWISLSCRIHILGIIRKKIRCLLFSHHLDEMLDLNLNGGIFAPARTLRRHLFDGIMEMLEFLFCQFLLGIWLIFLVRWSLSCFTYMVVWNLVHGPWTLEASMKAYSPWFPPLAWSKPWNLSLVYKMS